LLSEQAYQSRDDIECRPYTTICSFQTRRFHIGHTVLTGMAARAPGRHWPYEAKTRMLERKDSLAPDDYEVCLGSRHRQWMACLNPFDRVYRRLSGARIATLPK